MSPCRHVLIFGLVLGASVEVQLVAACGAVLQGDLEDEKIFGQISPLNCH